MSHDVLEPPADRVRGVPELPDMPEFVNEGPGFRGCGAKIRAPDLLGVMRDIVVSDAVVFTAPVRIVCCDQRVRNQGITEHEFQDRALTYGQASSRHFFVSSSYIHQRTIPQRGVTPGIISLRYRGPSHAPRSMPGCREGSQASAQ